MKLAKADILPLRLGGPARREDGSIPKGRILGSRKTNQQDHIDESFVPSTIST